ncbi:alpha/beta hydrolase [Mycobacterium sp. M1]|uniref:Alpha/beta hydrolase n=1 Tax=Mycolicibacter acidiphilus TaxID=2835306 RepID=A0ABS5RGS8_9MYCO|nr:alpha/beta hydrolase [Mycolicibacter acidiphilus]MBS9532839.1 alpha/beta hydrolase [Mycolicibacter acidiphilus]
MQSCPQVPTVASTRSKVTAFLTRYTLGVLTGIIPTNTAGVWFSRGLIATIMGVGGSKPRGTTVTPVRAPGVRGEWVLAPGVSMGAARNRAIYYVHGSAYVICSARTHRKIVARLSEATGLPVFVVDYRLAPEHRFPTAADDVAAGYRWLLTQGFAASDIVFAGDSAGGHLICDLLLAHADEPGFQPAGVTLFSPLIDLTLDLAERQEKIAGRDPAMSAGAAREVVALYTRGHNPDNPRLRLDFTRADRLPPLLVQVGGAEMLAADARYLADQLTRHGGDATLEVWPGQVHVFQALPRIAPEAKQALRRAADFIAAVYATDHTEQEVS